MYYIKSYDKKKKKIKMKLNQVYCKKYFFKMLFKIKNF